MKIPKTIAISALVILMTACASVPPSRYDGPGSFQDFANARYQCVRETSAPVSFTLVNPYGGGSSSSVMPNCSSFVACLASKGYYESENGRLDSASIVVDCN